MSDNQPLSSLYIQGNIVIARLLIVMLFVLLGFIVSPAWAQSGGLKLGPSDDSSDTLNLGATPPAGQDVTPPPRPSSATQPPGQRTEVKHGAWSLACDQGGQNCVMAQIGNDSSNNPVLEMVIRKLAEPLEVGERTAIAVLDIITPLGVALQEGLAVTIDDGRQERAAFTVCTDQGCLVREPIDEDLVTRLKKGNNVEISVIAVTQGEVKANVSLSGFTKAYNALK